MPEFEFAALFALAVLLASGLLAAMVLGAMPQIRRLKFDLAACPDKLEMRYTIVETVARWNDGTVVPLKLRQARLVPQPGARAAA
jgi:hypothetical protein